MERTLRVGEGIRLRRALFSRGWFLVYAGQPGEGTFSLALNWEFGALGGAYNLYFPIDQVEIEVPHGRLTVLNVSPRELRCRLEQTG